MRKLILFFMTTTFLMSCGGGGDNPDGPGLEPPREAKGMYQEGDKKYKIWYGGIFKINEVDNFKNLFPHGMTDATSVRIAGQVYQGLFKLNQETLETEVCLAESFEVNDNADTWTFKIRDNVFFHDNACFADGKGRKLTVDDVKYCFDKLCSSYSDNLLFELFTGRVEGAEEYYIATKNGNTPEGGVSGIRVVDANTLEIKLKAPFSAFDKVLTHNACWVFPKEAYEKYGTDMRVNCVGTGAFKVDVIKEDVQVRLVKNENYWESDEHGNKLPYLDVVKITFTKDKKTELSNFKRGNLDMVWKLPVDEMSSVLGSLQQAIDGENREYQYQSKNAMTVQMYNFLATNPVFSKKEVRQAFNYAIDREKLTKYTLQGEGEAAIHGLVPDFKGYRNESIEGFEFDLDKANKLMKDAGYPGGAGFPEITLFLNEGGKTNLILAEAIQSMLKENIGVTLNIQTLQMPVHIERMTTGQEGFWRMAWGADYPDPENFLKLFYGKTVPDDPNAASFPNASRYVNPVFDQMYERALSSTSAEERDILFHKCDSILIDDAAFMPIYYDEYIRLLQLDVRAFPQNPMEHRDLSRVFFSHED